MKGLVGQSAIYGLGELLPRAIGFLLLPLYTHYLAPSDYGLLAVLDMIGAYFAIVVNAGFSSALIRFWHEQESQVWRNRVFVSSVAVALAVGGFLLLLAWPFAGPAAELLFGLRDFAPFLLAILATVVLEVANGLVLTLFRVREDPAWYLRDTLLRLVLAVPMNVYFIAVLHLGILGFVISNLLTALALFLSVGLYFLWRHRARPDPRLARELASFALPFVPVGLIEAFLNQLGVLCLTLTGNLTLLGLFGVGQRIGSLVAYAYSPIGAAWIPYMYKIAKDQKAPEVYARAVTWLVLGLGGLVVFLAVFADALIGLLTPESYEGSAAVVLPLAVAALFFALRPSLRIGITLAKRTMLIPIATLLPAALGFPVTLALARAFEARGAAWGVALATAGVLLATAVLSQRMLALPYEYARLARVALAIASCAGAGALLPRDAHLLGALVVCAYPVLALLLGVPSRAELTRLRSELRAWRSAGA